MKDLRDMSIGHRVMLTVAIVVIIILVLACIGYLSGRWEAEAAQEQQKYEITKYEGDLLKIEHEAIDQAFKNQVVNVFAVWMKDETGQPGRAINGVVQARKAFVAAKTRLNEREAEYKRSLPK